MITLFFITITLIYELLALLKFPRFNVISVYTTLWGSLIAVALVPGIIYPALNDMTVAMLLVSVGSLALGGILVGLMAKGATSRDSNVSISVDERHLIKVHLAMTALLAVFAMYRLILLLPLINELGGLDAIFSTSAQEYRRAQLEGRLQDVRNSTFGASTLVTSVFGYVTYLGNASLYSGALLWRIGKRGLACMPLFISALYSLITLQRSSFFLTLMLFVVSIALLKAAPLDSNRQFKSTLVPRQRSRLRQQRSVLTSMIVAVVTYVVLILPLQLRNQGTHNSTGITSLLQYTLSGLAGLNLRNQAFESFPPPPKGSGEPGPFPGWGAYSFTNLVNILTRFSFPLPPAPVQLQFFDITILGESFFSNTATTIADMYLDGGWVGIVAISALIGACAVWAQHRLMSGYIDGLPIGAFFISVALWSFFGNSLLEDVRQWLVLGVSIIVLRHVTRRPRMMPRDTAVQPRPVSSDRNVWPQVHVAGPE